MIKNFKEYNEGFFYSDMDKYIKELLNDIKNEFDYSNMGYTIGGLIGYEFNYIIDDIYIKIVKERGVIPHYSLMIDNENVGDSVSYPIKYKLFNFFYNKYKKKEKEMEINKKEDIKKKIDPIYRKSNKYNL